MHIHDHRHQTSSRSTHFFFPFDPTNGRGSEHQFVEIEWKKKRRREGRSFVILRNGPWFRDLPLKLLNMLILSISAWHGPLPRPSHPLLLSRFRPRLPKRKQSTLNTSRNSRGADPIYPLVRLDTSNFHAPPIHRGPDADCCFRFLRPTRMARPVVPRQVSRCAPNWTFLPFFPFSPPLLVASRLHGCLFRFTPGAELPRHRYTFSQTFFPWPVPRLLVLA